MFMKSVLICIAGALLGHGYLTRAGNTTATPAAPAYVKLEVRGTLVGKDDTYAYFIQTSDGQFPQIKLLVKLERSEDKNRILDRYLESLKGKAVIVSGFLDCRRLAQETGVIYLYLSSESQIKPDGN